ncbi:D-apionate lactonase [Pararhizobium sp. PWRC1-1]|uniref:D-apionate lactonase n=1 Tax=Pararhizobium sp. PWRC1-1 TaxID=2804566 RepID=UPI003CF92CF6
MDADLAFRLYGTRQAEPASRLLKAGKLTAQLAGGNLRAITYDGVEVLRAISYLVRDRDWGTYDPTLADLAVTERETGFTVAYTARCNGPDGTLLDISAAIEGNTEGRLTFKGTARSTTGFETNRCGLCVLHPIVGVAGTPVTVEHVDGSIDGTRLPDLIEPWQPFKDMRAITHTAFPDVSVECRVEGDTFEMEDQRNWSDASYKTYVRPLALPWPYRIPANEPVTQQITLTIADRRTAAGNPPASAGNTGIIRLTPGTAAGTMPAIGLLITPEEAKASLAALRHPDAPRVQDLLFHFDPTAGHSHSAFGDFVGIAAIHTGTTTLEIAVPCQRPLDEELQEIAAWMRAAGFAPGAIMVCPSVDRQSTPPGSRWPDCPPLTDVYTAAAKTFPGIRLGGGMLSYFTELNRKRVPGENLAFISHCTNPIVHAPDDVSVMQSLEAMPFITRSVRAIYGNKPYRIGPSTIPMRQNPYGSRTMDNPDGGRIPMANQDPRHNGQFAAAFAAGYVTSVLDAGLETLTLSALTGPFGLYAGKHEPVEEGGNRPLHAVVKGLAEVAGQRWQAVTSSHPGRVLAFTVETEIGRTVWIANLTPEEQSLDATQLNVRSLPAKLAPFGATCIAF